MMLSLLLGASAYATEPIVVPYVTDPSPVIDGNVAEWTNRGAVRHMTGREHCTFSPEKWKSDDDLSGWVRFGHDAQQLYIVCHVVDSFFTQEQTGDEAWRGDHIMFTVDMARRGKILDVWQLGLNPGNLRGEDATKPELVIWTPLGRSIEGAVVAARRTPEGYDIEAAIPWTIFGMTPDKYHTFALQLAFSDCDTSPAIQEKAVSISTAKWAARDPKRLTPAGLADRAGHFPDGGFAEALELAPGLSIKHGEEKQLTFNVESIPQGKVPTLTFKGRVNWERTGGCCGPLAITVNGKKISRDNIANRPLVMTFLSGGTQTSWYGAGVTLWYGPDYESIEKSPSKPLDVVSYDNTLRLDGMIKPGANTITFRNADKRPNIEIVMNDVAFSWSSPTRFKAAKKLAPAPTGAIPTREPWQEQKVDYRAEVTGDGAVKVAWADREVVFASRFSNLKGGWTSGNPDGVDHQRQIVKQDECILVRDTFVNNSGKDRPLIIEHTAEIDSYETLYLGGRAIPMKTGQSSAPQNPSIAVLSGGTGIAVMPRNDVFRIHYRGGFDGKTLKLSDNSLVLRPGVTYEHEWLIFPLTVADYWRYANAARRHLGTNFTIPGSFTFFSLHKEDLPLLPWQIKDYIDRKNANFVSVGIGGSYKGLFPHGPPKRTVNPTRAITTNQVIRALRPDTKLLSYFNTFDCARRPNDEIRWPKCRILLPDGRQVHNGATYPLYFATLDNAYGKELDANVDWLLGTVGADGLYWDCYSYANIDHYAEPWDGWTGSIDPNTHELKRKRSSTTLLTWPYREKITKRLLDEGRPLVANSNPVLHSEYKYQFPRFVETADISAVTKGHLYTPIALGDHITERNEVDSYRWMLRSLDFGGLYYWYSGRIIPTHETLTSTMFPITIMEIHEGYIIGKERILTNRSGYFGWGDDSQYDVFVFDRVGRRTDRIKTPRIECDGKAYVELRLPEGFSAAIVRKHK